jgi:hypothetical protein
MTIIYDQPLWPDLPILFLELLLSSTAYCLVYNKHPQSILEVTSYIAAGLVFTIQTTQT